MMRFPPGTIQKQLIAGNFDALGGIAGNHQSDAAQRPSFITLSQ